MSGELGQDSCVQPHNPLWKGNHLLQKTWDGLENCRLILINSRCGLIKAKRLWLAGLPMRRLSVPALCGILLRMEQAVRCPHLLRLRCWEPVVLSLISFSPHAKLLFPETHRVILFPPFQPQELKFQDLRLRALNNWNGRNDLLGLFCFVWVKILEKLMLWMNAFIHSLSLLSWLHVFIQFSTPPHHLFPSLSPPVASSVGGGFAHPSLPFSPASWEVTEVPGALS